MSEYRRLEKGEADKLEGQGRLWVCPCCDHEADADSIDDLCPRCGNEISDDPVEPEAGLTSEVITTDGRTVWVNASDGSCIGRFSSKGVDVHRTGTEQMQGLGECLDCCHGLPFEESWTRFRTSMEKFHGVIVPDAMRPNL